MNKKGFTLVELIGVITLLAIVALISIPIITSSISRTNEKAYNTQVESIVSATKKWIVKNGSKNDTTFTVSLQELINDNLIENDVIIDPRDDSNMIEEGACVSVSYNNSSKSYSYNFLETCS